VCVCVCAKNKITNNNKDIMYIRQYYTKYIKLVINY